MLTLYRMFRRVLKENDRDRAINRDVNHFENSQTSDTILLKPSKLTTRYQFVTVTLTRLLLMAYVSFALKGKYPVVG